MPVLHVGAAPVPCVQASMSLCDTCIQPGNCCRGFVLVGKGFSPDNWQQEAQDLVNRNGMPFFKAVRPTLQLYRDSDVIGAFYNCDRLGADGRCTDYENRPQTCVRYEAGADALCSMHENKLNGIPIRVVAV